MKRLLLDKKIAFDFVPSYAIANKDNALKGKETKSPAKAGQLSSGTNKLNLAWRAMLLNARTFFEHF